MAPMRATAGPEPHDPPIKQLAPVPTIDGPQQSGYSRSSSVRTSTMRSASHNPGERKSWPLRSCVKFHAASSA